MQSLPAPGEARLEVGFVGDTSGTDLQQAIQLARALFAPDAAFRLLLITDGNQTRGSFIDAARASRASGAGVPIDVASVTYDRTHEVRLANLVVPSWTHANDTIDARIVIESGRECMARLNLLVNSRHVDLDPDSPSLSISVPLHVGSNLFTRSIAISGAPVHQVDAVVEPILSPGEPPDIPELLRASAVTFSSTYGRVLVLTEDAKAAQPFIDAVTARDTSLEGPLRGGVPRGVHRARRL